MSAKGPQLDHISEKSKEYSLSSKDKINLSSKFNNAKKFSNAPQTLNDSDLDKIPKSLAKLNFQSGKECTSLLNSGTPNDQSEHDQTGGNLGLRSPLRMLSEQNPSPVESRLKGSSQHKSAHQAQMQSRNEYQFSGQQPDEIGETSKGPYLIKEEAHGSPGKDSEQVASSQNELKRADNPSLFQNQTRNSKASLGSHSKRTGRFKFSRSKGSLGTRLTEGSRIAQRFSQNSFKSIENTSLYEKICQNYGDLIIKKIKHEEDAVQLSNQSFLTESEERLVRQLANSYISRRVDAFLFEKESGKSKKQSQSALGSESRLRQSTKSRLHLDSKLERVRESESMFKESRTFGQSQVECANMPEPARESQLVLVSRGAKTKSVMSNSSILTGMTFIDAEITKNYLERVIKDNIDILNRSHSQASSQHLFLSHGERGGLSSAKRTPRVMSLENFVQNCVNNWLDDVICSVNEDQTINQGTGSLARRESASQSSEKVSLQRVQTQEDLKLFLKSKQAFDSISYLARDQSDIVVSEQFMEKKELQKNSRCSLSSRLRDKLSRTSQLTPPQMPKKLEVVEVVNQACPGALGGKSVEGLSGGDSPKDFFESVNEQNLLSRQVTKMGTRELQNRTLGSEFFASPRQTELKMVFSDLNLNSGKHSSFQLPKALPKNPLDTDAQSKTVLSSKLQTSVYLYDKMKLENENQSGYSEDSKQIVEGNQSSYYFYDLGLVGSNWVGYKGEYKNGLKHGYGVWVLGNGEKYEGYFEEGKAHGKGKYTSKTGEVLVAFWKMNVLQHDESHRILLPKSEKSVEAKTD